MIKSSNSKVSAVKLLHKHLKPILGFNTYLFIPKVFAKISSYNKKFFSKIKEERILDASKTFLPVIALYYELSKEIGEERAREITRKILFEHTLKVQRDWYLRQEESERSWDEFHSSHEYQIKHSIIKNNVLGEIYRNNNTYKFDMLKCSFHEVFTHAEIPWLTEAMCKTDEIVFNEYSKEVKFHRGEGELNTLGRGGNKCVFIYERVTNS